MALDEEKNAYRMNNYGDGCLGKYLAEEKRRNLMDFDDSVSDKECEDIADLLPKDPFEMDFNMGLPNDPFRMDFNLSLPRDPFGMDYDIEATFEAIRGQIRGHIEDFGLRAYEFEADEAVEYNSNDDNSPKVAGDNDSNGDNKFFAELNFVWTGSMKYDQEDWENEVGDSGSVMYTEDGSYDDMMCFGCEKYEIEEHVKDGRDGDGGSAADMIIFILGYVDLGVKDLLSVERVCKPLHDAVRKDPYFWTKIHIDHALSLKITDDNLLRLTDRAQGKLRSLSLVKCLKITNDGLKQVLEKNLELTKLSVAGSIKLGVGGLLQNLKAFNSVAVPGIKCLRIGGPIGLTDEHLKEFKLLLGAHEDTNPRSYKPRFYRAGEIYLSLDDERVIDVETCPRCQKLGQVYDCSTEICQAKAHSIKTSGACICPTENCQAKTHSTETCRACIFCIARCICCGCCLEDKGYEETFCFDFFCFDCLEELFYFQDGVPISPGPTYFHPMARYHFFLYS